MTYPFIQKWKAEDGNKLKQYRAREFIRIIEEGAEIKEFDTDLYFRMLEKMTVFEDGKVVVKFWMGQRLSA